MQLRIGRRIDIHAPGGRVRPLTWAVCAWIIALGSDGHVMLMCGELP